MRIDWTDYQRVHTGRKNLLIHLLAVPLFVAGFIVIVVSVLRSTWLPATTALAICVIALVLQAGGHRSEAQAPRPFTGPMNFLRRWFTEQFVIFPLFLLTGRWWRCYRACGKMPTDAP